MDWFGAIDVEEYLCVEHEEEFILICVLMPRKLTLENAEANHCIVHSRECLIERGIRRNLGGYIDYF